MQLLALAPVLQTSDCWRTSAYCYRDLTARLCAISHMPDRVPASRVGWVAHASAHFVATGKQAADQQAASSLLAHT